LPPRPPAPFDPGGDSVAYQVWARGYYYAAGARDTTPPCERWPSNGFTVVFRCWKDGVVYDDGKYLASLARYGSPLAAVAAAKNL